MKKADPTPPRLAEKLLLKLLRDDLAEEVLGDLEEKFFATVERKSAWRAKLNYWHQAFNYLRPFAIRKSKRSNSNIITMFRHNLIISLRDFMRHKSSFLINLTGLSTSLTLALLIISYVSFELNYDRSYPLSDRMVRLTMDYLNGETVTDQDAETYPPIGPRLKAEMPEVADFARVQRLNQTNVKIGEDIFKEEHIYGVDPSFLQLFGYSLIHGSTEGIFKNPNEAVLTESIAMRYFGTTDVVGKTFRFNATKLALEVKIVGVTHDAPPNTHLRVNILVSFATLLATGEQKEDNWQNNNLYTYLLLTDSERLATLDADLERFTKQVNAEGFLENEVVIAQPISDIHLYSHKSYELETGGDAASVYILLGVALLIVFIAISNYINLSTSRALDRAKEVGIRKVVGSSAGQLRSQFLTESLLIHFTAGLAAFIFSLLCLDWFKYVTGLPASFSLLSSELFWMVLVLFVVVGGMLSGIVPAILLSRFQPISVLKGKFSRSSKGSKLRKALVVFQFGITGFLLVQTLIVNRQIHYMRGRALGMNVDNTVVVRMPRGAEYNPKRISFKNELLSYPQFSAVSVSSIVPGLSTSAMGSTNYIDLVGDDSKKGINFYINWIDEDFVATMKMDIVAGENFLANSENNNRVVVNEEAVRMWGIPSPQEAIGRTLQFWGRTATISGVIKNFHQTTAKSPYIPMIFLYDPPGNNNFLSIRLNNGDVRAQMETIDHIYAANFPNSRLDFFFLDQQFNQQYKSDEQFQEVFGLLSGFAILIACLGLFGLTSYTITQRTKEIGIRKVLGASATQIITLVSTDFMGVILLSVIVALPPTYYLVSSWLQQYAFRIDLNVWYFALPAVLVLAISFTTVFFKALRASNANPVNALRDE
jgi:putative ABC transport system permease protein